MNTLNPDNRIWKLFDQEFVLEFFHKRLLPCYPDFKSIKKVEIIPVKKQVWHTTYHVVIEYSITFCDQKKTLKTLPIFCTAHSSDPRKSVHNAMKYLWNNGFSGGFLTVPRPLFYSNFYKAAFYRGVKGKNLLYYIKQKDYPEIENITAKTAAWLAKLHSLEAGKAENFNEKTNRIESAIPGKKRVLAKIGDEHPSYSDIAGKIYAELENREKKFLKSTGKRWIIHGDAHPENVIKVGRKKIAMIDFADVCKSDFTRDLGSFLQQLEYMSIRRIGDRKFTDKLMSLFLKEYCKCSGLIITDSIRERIETYFNWTSFRSATFFLLKQDFDTGRADELIGQIKNNLSIKN